MSYLLSTKKQRVRHISFKALIRGNKVSRSRWGTFFLLLFLFAGEISWQGGLTWRPIRCQEQNL